MSRRAILGRGCDPVRATFAKNSWEPILGVEIDSATSDAELIRKLSSGKKYEVFFIAPGQCSLIRSGYVNGEDMIKTVKKYLPDIKIVMIEDVAAGLPLLANALNLPPVSGTQPLTEDWPFVD